MATYHQHFNFDKFVRIINSDLFRGYFDTKDVAFPSGINLNSPEEVKNLLLSLEQEKRLSLNEELQKIYDIAERQMERMQEAVRRHQIAFTEDDPPEDTAMRIFLHEDKSAFDEIYTQYLFDIYQERLYHYRFDHKTVKFTGKDIEKKLGTFQQSIAHYFKDQGKSDDCYVRKGVNGDKYFIIIARGDCVKTQLEFLNKQIIPHAFRPAKQDMVVFDKSTSTISITSSARSLDDKKKYVEVFGKNILGLKDIPEMTFKEKLVNIEPLKDDKFYEPTKEIEVITITRMTLRRRGSILTTIDLKSKDIRKSLEDMRIKLQYYDLLSASMKFQIHNIEKEVMIEIRPPEHTKIKQQAGRDIVEKYLQDKKVLLV